jgi:hypothetical protein
LFQITLLQLKIYRAKDLFKTDYPKESLKIGILRRAVLNYSFCEQLIHVSKDCDQTRTDALSASVLGHILYIFSYILVIKLLSGNIAIGCFFLRKIHFCSQLLTIFQRHHHQKPWRIFPGLSFPIAQFLMPIYYSYYFRVSVKSVTQIGTCRVGAYKSVSQFNLNYLHFNQTSL